MAAASTRSRVSSLTDGLPLSARLTVGWETPARAAMSNEVGRRVLILGKGIPLHLGHAVAVNVLVGQVNTYV